MLDHYRVQHAAVHFFFDIHFFSSAVGIFLALAPVRVYEDQLTPRIVTLPENRKAVEICTR